MFALIHLHQVVVLQWCWCYRLRRGGWHADGGLFHRHVQYLAITLCRSLAFITCIEFKREINIPRFRSESLLDKRSLSCVSALRFLLFPVACTRSIPIPSLPFPKHLFLSLPDNQISLRQSIVLREGSLCDHVEDLSRRRMSRWVVVDRDWVTT